MSYGSKRYGGEPPLLRPTAASSSRALLWKTMTAFLSTLVFMGFVIQYTALSDSLQFVDASTTTMSFAAVEPPTNSKILQDILHHVDTATNDPATLTIAYKGKPVHDGEYVPMNDAAAAPSAELNDGGDGQYTWILIDIDAPDPANPTHSPFLHYIVANLDPKQPSQQQIVVPYYPVTPPIGNHRYVSLLFEQTETEPETDSMWHGSRSKFDVVQFVKKHKIQYVSMTHFYSKPN